MKFPIILSPGSALKPDLARAEIVERKGLGHPDTVCDAIAEEFSLALSRFYLERFGLVLHHNVDKVLLWGGAAKPAFNGGSVTAPIEIFLAGRAAVEYQGIAVPVEDIAHESCRFVIGRHIPGLDFERHVRLHVLVRPGSVDLEELFLRQKPGHCPLANDTSCGVGFALLSQLETVVLTVEQTLQSPEFRQRFPFVGTDIKIMGVRRDDMLYLTLGCAFIDKYINNIKEYIDKKHELNEMVLHQAVRYTDRSVSVASNTADNPQINSIFMTVTGTSAESGDDGEAGRGNRANGLITPYRPMTMESVAGKNPITHVGKLYNVMAGLIADDIVREIDECDNAECYLASQIGQPIDQPQMVEVRLPDEISGASRTNLDELVTTRMDEISTLWRDFIYSKIVLDRWPLIQP